MRQDVGTVLSSALICNVLYVRFKTDVIVSACLLYLYVYTVGTNYILVCWYVTCMYVARVYVVCRWLKCTKWCTHHKTQLKSTAAYVHWAVSERCLAATVGRSSSN